MNMSSDTRSGKTFSYVKGSEADGVRFPQIFNTSNYTLFHLTRCRHRPVVYLDRSTDRCHCSVVILAVTAARIGKAATAATCIQLHA